VVLFVALIFQRGLNLLAYRHEKIEHLSQGKMSLLVKDGVLVLDEMEKIHMTKQQVFSFLREKKINNLGKVQRAYLEACGIFSVYEASDSKPGLPVFPGSDPGIKNIQRELPDHTMACCNCGHVQNVANETTACEICNVHEWTKAYLAN
ncbi:MAG TPA: YetF domain-containing protein, partial [Segetibacter sp.]